jgi:hypothetical protein
VQAAIVERGIPNLTVVPLTRLPNEPDWEAQRVEDIFGGGCKSVERMCCRSFDIVILQQQFEFLAPFSAPHSACGVHAIRDGKCVIRFVSSLLSSKTAAF